MSEHSSRAREISDFIDALRHRSDNPTGGGASADLLAWKASLLGRIAADSADPEAQQVADHARAQLDHARNTTTESGGDH
ncbi:hypothetical protein [Halostreptopolyspora alba]|uniref:Uncharacterized protein n=1 Tax=Halostreptopolyspora alba TaxID=2487137 RepID=A0A3N0E8Z9_9ACTN|nr:hypothetical protein EFW17_12205 [Nocardiopsaceae bacterium YIM 96095]